MTPSRLPKSLIAVALAATAGAALAQLGPVAPTVTGANNDQTRAYVGVEWTFGVRSGAAIVLGYRDARVSGNKARGAGLEMVWTLSDGIAPAEARVFVFDGSRTAQAQFGAGYAFLAGAPLMNLAVQAPYVAVGSDYLFGKGWQPYVGVNSHRKYDPPTGGTLTCPPGYFYYSPANGGDGMCILPN